MYETQFYRALCDWLPEMRTGSHKVLDVKALAEQLDLSKEGFYKWLRKGRILSNGGADRLFQVVTSPANLEALERAGTPAPSHQDILRFLLS